MCAFFDFYGEYCFFSYSISSRETFPREVRAKTYMSFDGKGPARSSC